MTYSPFSTRSRTDPRPALIGTRLGRAAVAGTVGPRKPTPIPRISVSGFMPIHAADALPTLKDVLRIMADNQIRRDAAAIIASVSQVPASQSSFTLIKGIDFS